MRKYKFRAWIKKDKRMEDVDFINFAAQFAGKWKCKKPDADLFSKDEVATREGKLYNLEDVELMQYAGFKDKKGKEIYEGDVVKAKVEEMYEVGNNEFKADILEVVGAIKFLNGCFCIYCNEYDFFSLENVIGGNQIEIIGNIFKNPELLEQE